MKKVLILAYDFPPYVSVGGLRPYSWYKHFREFGLEPIVVTRQWGNKYGNHLDYIAPGESDKTIMEETEYGTIIRTPYVPNLANRMMLKYGEKRFQIVRKSISAFYEFAQYFLPVGPKARIYKEAQQYLKTHSVDAIIATGEPFVLFNYASNLSRKYKILWIADYRDPWVQNKARNHTFLSSSLNRFYEKISVSNATVITTVSEFFAHQIELFVKNKSMIILPNGFDESSVLALDNVNQSSREMHIAFVGTIYKWHPIESFLRVFAKFIMSKGAPNVKLLLYGTNLNSDSLNQLMNSFPALENHIQLIPKLSNEELLSRLAHDNAMLLFNYYSYMGTKIYDYLAVKRKIIFCYSDDKESEALKNIHFNIQHGALDSLHLQADLINETNSGIVVKDAEHLHSVLEELYAEFQAKGFIECHSINVEQYSRKKQTEKLAELIKSTF